MLMKFSFDMFMKKVRANEVFFFRFSFWSLLNFFDDIVKLYHCYCSSGLSVSYWFRVFNLWVWDFVRRLAWMEIGKGICKLSFVVWNEIIFRKLNLERCASNEGKTKVLSLPPYGPLFSKPSVKWNNSFLLETVEINE